MAFAMALPTSAAASACCPGRTCEYTRSVIADPRGLADDRVSVYGKRPPIQPISIELVQRLLVPLGSGINVTPGPFLTLLPTGWYRVEYRTQVVGSDNWESVRELIMVFQDEQDGYGKFIQYAANTRLDVFGKEDVRFDDIQNLIERWKAKFLPSMEQRSARIWQPTCSRSPATLRRTDQARTL